MLPERIRLRIGEPLGLVRQGGPGGEQAHAGAAAAEPVVEGLHRIGRQHVDRIDAGEALRHGRDCVRHIAVVVPISRRGMHNCGLGDAGLVHRVEHRLVGRRPLARPGRLRPAERVEDRGHGVLLKCAQTRRSSLPHCGIPEPIESSQGVINFCYSGDREPFRATDAEQTRFSFTATTSSLRGGGALEQHRRRRQGARLVAIRGHANGRPHGDRPGGEPARAPRSQNAVLSKLRRAGSTYPSRRCIERRAISSAWCEEACTSEWREDWRPPHRRASSRGG